MTDTTFELFDEFAARFARGENLDVREYLGRAGTRADELAALIDAFLSRAEPRAPQDEAVELARAWVAGEPPLLELRKQRGLRVDQVVDALVSILGIDARKRLKVKRYYQQLEGGLLEPRRVDASVWDALSTRLDIAARELAAWRPRPLSKEMAYFRVQGDESAPSAASVEPPTDPADEDEVDRLFGVASRTR